MSYSVYIMTNRKDGTLYIGMTDNLARRVYEHREKLLPGFTQKYNLDRLVYYECYKPVEDAIQREKKHERMETRVEDRADREHESGLAGFV